MTKRYFTIITVAVIGSIVAALPACAAVSVFVSILPQKYFVRQIGGDLVDVHVMVPPGAGPATYEPKPRQMMALSTAAVYFAAGVPFERAWLDKIAAANPNMRIVHTDDGIEKIPMADHHHAADPSRAAHGDETLLDPHIWLSPPLVKIQAGHIFNTLAAIDPGHEETYATNYHAFLGEIDSLHRQLLAVFAGKQGAAFMVFHPSWGYFANTYGLRQIPIELEGKEPKPVQLKDLITKARSMGIKVVFAQPQFSAKSARVIAGAIKGTVILADPLAENWADNLRTQALKFRQALR